MKAKDRRSRDYRRACYGKVRHPDQAAAEAHAAECNLDRPITLSPMQSYECPYCSRWHVGHGLRRVHA